MSKFPLSVERISLFGVNLRPPTQLGSQGEMLGLTSFAKTEVLVRPMVLLYALVKREHLFRSNQGSSIPPRPALMMAN
jgi:hypothetical protein